MMIPLPGPRMPAHALRSPYGLTLISNGRVAVFGYNSNAVKVFAGKDEVLFRYPPDDN
jgi:hypothetical protein